MKQCPKCQNWTLEFDDYFGRFRCFDADCGWMPLSSLERAMRLQQSYTEPTLIYSTPIEELGITFTAKHDETNDALVFDFGLNTPTFEFPEGDGRMVWEITRSKGPVAGFVILGIKEFGMSHVKIKFGARKTAVEEAFRRLPDTVAVGRSVTRIVIENVEAIAQLGKAEPTDFTDAFQDAIAKFEKSLCI